MYFPANKVYRFVTVYIQLTVAKYDFDVETLENTAQVMGAIISDIVFYVYLLLPICD